MHNYIYAMYICTHLINAAIKNRRQRTEAFYYRSSKVNFNLSKAKTNKKQLNKNLTPQWSFFTATLLVFVLAKVWSSKKKLFKIIIVAKVVFFLCACCHYTLHTLLLFYLPHLDHLDFIKISPVGQLCKVSAIFTILSGLFVNNRLLCENFLGKLFGKVQF